MHRVAVFGATGQAGRLISRLLLEEDGIGVTACSRSPEKLAGLQRLLGIAGSRLRVRAADVRRADEVAAVAGEVDVVVGATSRWQDGPLLAAGALARSTHYCGISLSNPEKWSRLRELESASVDRGVMLVDDCGTHPGLPAVMIRWMAGRVPLRCAWVGAEFGLEWNRLEFAPETVADFLSEIESTDPSLLADGGWKRGYRHARRFDFGDGRGPRVCIPMLMEEIREVASEGGLESTGFFVAGFGPVADYVVMPLSMVLARIHRGTAEKLLWWGLRRFASRPGTAVLQLEGTRAGSEGAVRLRVSHSSPYFLTAAAVVGTIRQMLRAPRAGVWTQGSFVEPPAFLASLERMGACVEAFPPSLRQEGTSPGA